MGAYDIAVKVILSHCRETALEYFLNLPVQWSEILELPQETPSVRRADFPIRVRTTDGEDLVVLLEVQSQWEPEVPLRLLEYDARYRLKTGLSVVPAVMLLRHAPSALDHFQDRYLSYRFHLLSLATLDARDIVATGKPCLMPFVGLMKGGAKLLGDAENILYQSDLSRSQKADLLTGMALLAGLVSPEFPRKLFERRKDIMMESAAYEMIKKEGYEEGIQRGLEQGLQQGLEKGLQQGLEKGLQQGLEQGIKQGTKIGMIEEAREAILDVLTERFGECPLTLREIIVCLDSISMLKALRRQAIQVESLAAFRELLDEWLKEA